MTIRAISTWCRILNKAEKNERDKSHVGELELRHQIGLIINEFNNYAYFH